MSPIRLLSVLLLVMTSLCSEAQTDSVLQSLQQIPLKYINQVDSKIDKYSCRITNRTEKTLTKLSRWENKIRPLLQKANPAAAERLFGEGKPTFTSLLQQFNEGKVVVENYRTQYDEYRDKLSTSLKYLEDQKQKLDNKLLNPIHNANQKLDKLEDDVQQQEAVEAFIKERRKQLFDEAVKYLGKSKYLTKINKESYYYIETIKNYKQIFNDKQKAEETALVILNKIPAFRKFIQENSMLASLFRMPGTGGNSPNLDGLQTRASVNALIQNQIAAGGPNAAAQISENIQAAQSQLIALKNKILKAGGSNSSDEMPNFKPNTAKTKTFKQRLELGNNIQFTKNNSALPTTADIGLSLGYKLNTKSIIGIGASYKMGLGSIQNISISHQGIGLRSFIDWQLKKQFYFTGGYEMNFNAAFKTIEQLRNFSAWQNAGLIGLSKKINVKTKFTKQTKIQLLYDLFAKQHAPISQPIIFRTGYNF